MEIQTPYGSLFYPAQWTDILRVIHTVGESDTFAFFAQIEDSEVRLFDISFDGDQGGYIGMVEAENGAMIPVNLTIYTLSPATQWSADVLQTVFAMQDDVNYLIERMPLQKRLEEIDASDEIVYKDVAIDTPYGQLKYPGKWGNQLYVDTVDDDVYTISCYARINENSQCHLFDMYFGGEIGTGIGEIVTDAEKRVTVRVVSYPIERTEDLSETQIFNLYAMQEVLSDLIDQLPLVQNDDSSDSEDLVVETPYCSLYFPGKWEQNLVVESIDGEIYGVAFWGKMGFKDPQKLFTISFGGTEGILLGELENDSGEKIPVYVIPIEFFPDEDWTKDEIDGIYSMQEEMNYLISKLSGDLK